MHWSYFYFVWCLCNLHLTFYFQLNSLSYLSEEETGSEDSGDVSCRYITWIMCQSKLPLYQAFQHLYLGYNMNIHAKNMYYINKLNYKEFDIWVSVCCVYFFTFRNWRRSSSLTCWPWDYWGSSWVLFPFFLIKQRPNYRMRWRLHTYPSEETWVNTKFRYTPRLCLRAICTQVQVVLKKGVKFNTVVVKKCCMRAYSLQYDTNFSLKSDQVMHMCTCNYLSCDTLVAPALPRLGGMYQRGPGPSATHPDHPLGGGVPQHDGCAGAQTWPFQDDSVFIASNSQVRK